jgi:regulatory protein
MPKEKKQQTLREQALAYLARREHSRYELFRKLERGGHASEEITTLLDEFQTKNWLSDQRFAESYVADHRARSGSLKLAYELRQRGVPESTIQAVLTNQRYSELERASEIWQKKFGSPPANAQEKARQLRFIQSRGFSPEIFRKLFNNCEGIE